MVWKYRQVAPVVGVKKITLKRGLKIVKGRLAAALYVHVTASNAFVALDLEWLVYKEEKGLPPHWDIRYVE